MASRLCQRLEILFPQAARHIQQSSCVPDFQHQALASQDGLSMVSQDEAFTHLLLLITERKELQEKCYEKNLPGLMRHFSPPSLPKSKEKDFVGPSQPLLSLWIHTSILSYILLYFASNKYSNTILNIPLFWLYAYSNTSNNFSSILFI